MWRSFLRWAEVRDSSFTTSSIVSGGGDGGVVVVELCSFRRTGVLLVVGAQMGQLYVMSGDRNAANISFDRS